MKLWAAGLAITAVIVGGGAATVARAPDLEAIGTVSVSGTPSGTFTIGDRDVRQVRYVDRGTLSYEFTLHNPGRLGVTVHGVGEPEHESTLLRIVSLTSAAKGEFEIGAGDDVEVLLEVLMTDCERLSARASSLVSTVPLEISVVGIDHDIEVALPEELRTGSARETDCPLATATSRPPG